jgi:hypothetical protein
MSRQLCTKSNHQSSARSIRNSYKKYLRVANHPASQRTGNTSSCRIDRRIRDDRADSPRQLMALPRSQPRSGAFPSSGEAILGRITGAALLATPRHVLTEATVNLDQILRVDCLLKDSWTGAADVIGKVVAIKCNCCGWIKVFGYARSATMHNPHAPNGRVSGKTSINLRRSGKLGRQITPAHKPRDYSREATSRYPARDDSGLRLQNLIRDRILPMSTHSDLIGEEI